MFICLCGGVEDLQVEEDGARYSPCAVMEKAGHGHETGAPTAGEKSVIHVVKDAVIL